MHRNVLLWIVILWSGSCIAPSSSDAQIINTLRGFDADAMGWSGELAAAFSHTGGNSEILTLLGDAQTQWQNNSHRVRLLSSIVQAENDGSILKRASVLHLRHNVRLLPWLSSLGFTQLQHSDSQRLQRRLLFGAGARFDIYHQEAHRLSMGAAHMYEIETIDDAEEDDKDHRLSTFVTWAGQLGSGVEIDLTGFYQPLWSEFSDARATVASSLTVPLFRQLSLELKGGYQYDSEPPPSVEEEDWSYTTGFRFAL